MSEVFLEMRNPVLEGSGGGFGSKSNKCQLIGSGRDQGKGYIRRPSTTAESFTETG